MNIEELIKNLDPVSLIEFKNYILENLSDLCSTKNSNSKVISKFKNKELFCDKCKFLPICQGGYRGGYFGYIDYMCNHSIHEINDILETKIRNGIKIDSIDVNLKDDDILLN